MILRERQLLMRVLKLWVVIDNSSVYDLIEEKPLIIESDKPITIVAKNGYHTSRLLHVKQPHQSPVFIEVGCTADNGRLWGGILLSIFAIILFISTGFFIFLLLANAPLLYLIYLFFFQPKKFITISFLRPDKKTHK